MTEVEQEEFGKEEPGEDIEKRASEAIGAMSALEILEAVELLQLAKAYGCGCAEIKVALKVRDSKYARQRKYVAAHRKELNAKIAARARKCHAARKQKTIPLDAKAP